MTTPATKHRGDIGILDYLQVDSFLRTLIDSRALAAAIELGLLDYLQAHPDCPLADLFRDIDADRPGMLLLLKLLTQNNVVVQIEDRLRLDPRFLQIMPFFPLLQAKIEFADEAAADVSAHLTGFIQSETSGRQQSRIFRLFDYRRGFEDTPENRERTRRWMRVTTALTRHEAPVCMSLHDFSPHRRMLDIGGNSGEFAFQVCQRVPLCSAVVFDLPMVCRIGQDHLRGEPGSDRIKFVQGNALLDDLPKGFDLITFKSMLHDWPAEGVETLLERADRALSPGGTLLIFERGPVSTWPQPTAYSALPFLLFFRSFRSPERYTDFLSELHYNDIRVQWIDLDMPFFLMTAIKRK